jgi:hypothetical protein
MVRVAVMRASRDWPRCEGLLFSGDKLKKYFVYTLADRLKFVYWARIMAATFTLMRDLPAAAAGNICPGLSTDLVARSRLTRFG